MNTENATQSEEVMQLEPKDIKRPWYVYLMAVWAFIGIGGLLAAAARYFTNPSDEQYKVAAVFIMIFAITLAVNIIRMKKLFIIIFGVLCAAIAALQIFNMAYIAYQGFPVASLTPMLIFLLPSAVFAALSLRPKFLKLALAFREPIEREAMMKYAMKKIRG